MCMSCSKTNLTKTTTKGKSYGGSKSSGSRKSYVSAANPFGKPKVRISFANRKT